MQQGPKEGRQELSPALEKYLEAIFRLESRDGAVRGSSIAEAVQVSRSTVTGTLKILKAMGYIKYSPYSLIYLTEKGKKVGMEIAHRHFVFQTFLNKVLFLDSEESQSTARALEHVVAEDVIKRLGQFVLFLNNCSEDWSNWMEVYKQKNILQQSHTQSTIAEVLGRAKEDDKD